MATDCSLEEAKRKRDLYPSSKGSKNWDQITSEVVQEEKPEGDEALNKFFQEIFCRGNEETRRAMNKSFYESGGTVLSTNWTEVGKDKVKGSPPPGLEMKEWKDMHQ
jgi:suppressor of G2 allele of SKP1